MSIVIPMYGMAKPPCTGGIRTLATLLFWIIVKYQFKTKLVFWNCEYINTYSSFITRKHVNEFSHTAVRILNYGFCTPEGIRTGNP